MSGVTVDNLFPSAASLNSTSHLDILIDHLPPSRYFKTKSPFWLNNKSFTLGLNYNFDALNTLKGNKIKKSDSNYPKFIKGSHSRKKIYLPRLLSRSIKSRDNTLLQRVDESDLGNFEFDTKGKIFTRFKCSSISEFSIPSYIQLFDHALSLDSTIRLYPNYCNISNFFNENIAFLNERYYTFPVLKVSKNLWHKNCCTIQDFCCSSEYIPLYCDKILNDAPNIIYSSVLSEELSLKKSDYQKRLLVDPNNVALWLEYAEFEIICNDHLDGFESNIADTKSQTVFQNSLQILKTALSTHPSSFCLISKYMSLYAKLYNYNMALLKWREFLFIFPQSSLLWNQYINFLCQCFDHFKCNEIIKIFESAFKRLISIVEEEFLSSTPELEAEKNLISLVVKYCHFLKLAGYDERAISSILALIQFNSMPSNSITDKQRLILQFQTNWNTKGFLTSLKHELFSYITPCQIQKNSFEANNVTFDSVNGLNESWVIVERNRSESWFLVPPNLSGEAEICDNEKEISASVLVPILFTLHSNNHLFQLTLHAMLLMGIPISMTSQVDKTFLDTEGIVVEIDAKEWISLLPLYFTGTVVISSVNTHKLDFKTPRLTSEQTKLIGKILNYMIPIIDYEHQAILIITWFEYEINCLGCKLDDLKYNKFIRKQIKSILALEMHNNNIALWGAFMIICSYVSTIPILFKIPASIFLQYANSTSSFERLFCFHSTLHLCTTVEKRFSINTSTFQLYLLDCVSSNNTPQLAIMLKLLLQKEPQSYYLSYSQILKMKQNLWEKTKLSLKSDYSTSLFSLLYSTFYLAVVFLLNRKRLSEFCVGFQLLWNHCDNSTLSSKHQYKKKLMDSLLYIVIKKLLRCLNCDYLPKYLASLIHRFGFHISNPHLYKLLWGEFRLFNINLVLRSDLSFSGYICMLSLYVNMLNEEIDQSSRRYIINILKITFEDAIHKYPCALILWLFNIDIIEYVGINDMNSCFFIQATKKHPGVKKLYTEWSSFEPKQLSYIITLLEEKEIRICCPIEEFILMQKAII